MSCFAGFCKSYLGCAPYFPLWLHLFYGKTQPAGNAIQDAGGVTFQERAGTAYPKIKLPKKIPSWKKGFFYVQEEVPARQISIPSYSVKPSAPVNLKPLSSKGDEEMV
jgi:hypothetical protein